MLSKSSEPAFRFRGYIEPCLPTRVPKAPTGGQWVHEIKHDGYRLIVRREGDRVRIFTRRGYDWSGRYPRVAEGLLSLRVESIVLDGEGVYCRPDGHTDSTSCTRTPMTLKSHSTHLICCMWMV